MFIHHILAIALIMASWTVNAVRGGSLIAFIHEIADTLLEGAKTSKNAAYEKVASFFFISFALAWIITRLVMFSRIIYFGIVEVPKIFMPCPFYYVLAAMNVFLLILNILWTFLIFKSILKIMKDKQFEDIRSCTEDEIVSS
ncbi:hypothetical protein ACKWTF_005351 [Chironomus riparius]